MLTITLTRNPPKGKAVTGKLLIPFSQRPIYDDVPENDAVIDTLENADFLIPAGVYPLQMTYSRKFDKKLPLIDEVPDRTGIRIHRGTIPEHSTGCVLTDMKGMTLINVLFNRLFAHYDNEQIYIDIR